MKEVRGQPGSSPSPNLRRAWSVQIGRSNSSEVGVMSRNKIGRGACSLPFGAERAKLDTAVASAGLLARIDALWDCRSGLETQWPQSLSIDPNDLKLCSPAFFLDGSTGRAGVAVFGGDGHGGFTVDYGAFS